MDGLRLRFPGRIDVSRPRVPRFHSSDGAMVGMAPALVRR
jgi:hypothetical protein